MARITPTLIGKPGWARCGCGRLYEAGTNETNGVCDTCTRAAYRTAQAALASINARAAFDLGTAKP